MLAFSLGKPVPGIQQKNALSVYVRYHLYEPENLIPLHVLLLEWQAPSHIDTNSM